MNKKFVFFITGPIILIITGVFGFHFVENLSFLDSIYLTSATITTVGYGDIHPTSARGEIFSLFLMFGGVGIFTYSLAFITNFIVEGELKNIYGGGKWRHR
ncbi:MAG: potassium channel family protein [Methanofastidiosum sp.]